MVREKKRERRGGEDEAGVRGAHSTQLVPLPDTGSTKT